MQQRAEVGGAACVEAGVRVITTPHHAVDKEGSRPRILEMITANGQNYGKIEGGPRPVRLRLLGA